MMNLVDELSASPVVIRIGWTLLHFIWQGAAVAALLAVLLWLLARAAASVRYLAAISAMLLMALLPVVTFQLIPAPPGLRPSPRFAAPPAASKLPDYQITQLPDSPIARLPDSKPAPALAHPENYPRQAGGYMQLDHLQPLLPWLVAAWSLGVILLALYHLGGFVAIQRLKTLRTHPPAALAQSLLLQLAQRMKLSRPVKLLTSALVQTPVVLGHLRPVILLPASILSGLSSQQLEAILAHELAHIRRHDYLVNLLQAVVETLLFYHPAVWWVSQKIRQERENCCDDAAAKLCGDRLLYAQALVSLEELRTPNPSLALAATGGSMLTRIRRLLNLPPQCSTLKTRSLAAALIILSAMAFTITLVKCSAIPGNDKSSDNGIVDATALVNEIRRPNEKWIESVNSFHMKAQSTWTYSPEGERANIRSWKELLPAAKPGTKQFPEISPVHSDTIEIAFDRKRLLFDMITPGWGEDLKIWDGAHGRSHRTNDWLKKDDRREFNDPSFAWGIMSNFSWPRADQYQFWWETKPSGGPGDTIDAGEFKYVRKEFQEIDCYVLERHGVLGALAVRWFVGVKDHLLHKLELGRLPGDPEDLRVVVDEAAKHGVVIRNEAEAKAWLESLSEKDRQALFESTKDRLDATNKPCIEHWMSDYVQVKPGCWFPMTQGYLSYGVNQGDHFDYGTYDHPLEASRRDIHVTEVTVDKALPDELFTMTFPATQPASTAPAITSSQPATVAELIRILEREKKNLARLQELQKTDSAAGGDVLREQQTIEQLETLVRLNQHAAETKGQPATAPAAENQKSKIENPPTTRPAPPTTTTSGTVAIDPITGNIRSTIDGRTIEMKIVDPPTTQPADPTAAKLARLVEIEEERMTLVKNRSTGTTAIYTTSDVLDQEKKVIEARLRLEEHQASAQIGEFYMMGDVPRTGVYSLSGRKINILQAIAAAGGDATKPDGLVITLVRRLPENKEQIHRIPMKALVDDRDTDMILQPNDVIMIAKDERLETLLFDQMATRASLAAARQDPKADLKMRWALQDHLDQLEKLIAQEAKAPAAKDRESPAAKAATQPAAIPKAPPYTDAQAKAFAAKLSSLSYPTEIDPACKALGIDSSLLRTNGLMFAESNGTSGQSYAQLSPTYWIAFQHGIPDAGVTRVVIYDPKSK